MALRYSVIVSFMFIVFAEGTSWTSKEKQREYNVYSLKKGPETDWARTDVTCDDELSGCQSLHKLCNLKIVKRKCADTCGVCRAAAPADCKLTQYKCCWDNVTTAKGPNSEGCPLCADKYDECSMFKNMCGQHNIRTMCPDTCAINCKQCSDNKFQHVVCPMYKRYGFCELSPDLMQKMCSKTCGFCAS